MTKTLQIALELELVRYTGQTSLGVVLDSKAIRDWTLGLCLLQQDLIEVLVVTDQKTKRQLNMRLAGPRRKKDMPNRRFLRKSEAVFETDVTRLEMTRDFLDYVIEFYLIYFRDGTGQVNHIDMDVVAPAESQEATITFKVPLSVPAVSHSEPKRTV
jgi:hypothetical protein